MIRAMVETAVGREHVEGGGVALPCGSLPLHTCRLTRGPCAVQATAWTSP